MRDVFKAVSLVKDAMELQDAADEGKLGRCITKKVTKYAVLQMLKGVLAVIVICLKFAILGLLVFPIRFAWALSKKNPLFFLLIISVYGCVVWGIVCQLFGIKMAS